MRKIIKSYLEKYKASLFIPLSFIFLILILPFSSATASFYAIPDVNLEYNTYFTVDLRNYCTSNEAGNSCRFTSYGVQFTNPDNSQSIFLFPSESSSNSYFDITLSANGLVTLLSKNKNLNADIIVYGADAEYSSQASGSFTLNIAQSQIPTQIANFFPPTLYGNQTQTYNMSGFFLNYNKIGVAYNDDVLQRTVSFTQTLTTSSCTTGQIRVCLNGNGNSITLSIQGQNRTYNSSVTGGNLIFVRAINQYGEVSDNGFPVITFPSTATIQTFSNLPIRAPFSIAPALMNFNDTYQFNLSILYSNYSSVNASFFTGGTIGMLLRNFTGLFACTSVTGTTCFPVSQGAERTYVDFSNFTISLYFNDLLVINSKNVNQNNYPVNLSACNNIGCVAFDDFGNRDTFYVNVSGRAPVGVPLSFAPIVLGYQETKFFNFNDMFSGATYFILNWSEGTDNLTLRTPATSYNVSTFLSGADVVYQNKLYFNNLFSVTSTNINHNFTIYPLACNTAGCVSSVLGIQQSILFIIQDTSELQEIDVESGYFRNLFNVILGLFPDKDTLTEQGKANFVLITIALIAGIIMLFGYKAGGTMLPLVYFAGIVSFFVFVFFVAKGYIPTLAIAIPILIGLLLLIFKLRNGN